MILAKSAGVLLAAVLASAAVGASAATPYDIDVILPMSGFGAFLGKGEIGSLNMVEKIINTEGGINGQPVHFTVHDDQSNPQVAVQLANTLIAKAPAVLLGPSLTATCNALGPLMASGPVMYCLSPGIHPKAASFVYSASISTFDLQRVLLRYFRLRGWTRLALITSTDASGQDGERGLERVAAMPENAGVKFVTKVHFNPGDVSLAAQMAMIHAANPQALIVWSTGSAVAAVFQGLVQAGIDIPVATTDGNMTHAQMNQYARFLPKHLFIPAAVWAPHDQNRVKLDPKVDQAINTYYASLKSVGLQPDQPSSQIWDTASIIVNALRHLGAKASAAKLREYLANLQGYAGICGIYDFKKTPQRGVDEANTLITEWSPTAKNWLAVSQPRGVPLAN